MATDNTSKLATPRTARGPRGAIGKWFHSNPKALALVEDWLRMRAEGTTVWSVPDLIGELVETHGMPEFGPSGMQTWLSRERGEAYRKAMLGGE